MVERSERDRFLAELQALDGSAGNVRLREILGWDEAAYGAVKDALIADGAVAPGRGRGGSVMLASGTGDGAHLPRRQALLAAFGREFLHRGEDDTARGARQQAEVLLREVAP